MLLGKIPAVKRKFEEQGTSQEEVVNKVWGDKRYGFGIMISGGGLKTIEWEGSDYFAICPLIPPYVPFGIRRFIDFRTLP